MGSDTNVPAARRLLLLAEGCRGVYQHARRDVRGVNAMATTRPTADKATDEESSSTDCLCGRGEGLPCFEHFQPRCSNGSIECDRGGDSGTAGVRCPDCLADEFDL